MACFQLSQDEVQWQSYESHNKPVDPIESGEFLWLLASQEGLLFLGVHVDFKINLSSITNSSSQIFIGLALGCRFDSVRKLVLWLRILCCGYRHEWQTWVRWLVRLTVVPYKSVCRCCFSFGVRSCRFVRLTCRRRSCACIASHLSWLDAASMSNTCFSLNVEYVDPFFLHFLATDTMLLKKVSSNDNTSKLYWNGVCFKYGLGELLLLFLLLFLFLLLVSSIPPGKWPDITAVGNLWHMNPAIFLCSL